VINKNHNNHLNTYKKLWKSFVVIHSTNLVYDIMWDCCWLLA